jgi:hypothetical protein
VRSSIEDLTAIQRKSNNKTCAGRGLNPNLAAVIEDSLAGHGQTDPEAVSLPHDEECLLV